MLIGKDRGRKGRVLAVRPKENRVIVEGLNIVKKHRRPRRMGEKGQLVQLPRAVDVSNVMLVCSKCGEVSRLGYSIVEGKKYRICKKCGSET
jgi:large subunit ribosomal protein L24